MSQPLVIGAVTIAVLDTTITDLQSTSGNVPALRIAIGGFVVMVVLLALSDYDEGLADSVAILLLLATLVGPKGGALSKLVTKLVQNGPAISAGDTITTAANRGVAVAASNKDTTHTQN